MIVLVGKCKRWQVQPVGKEKVAKGILTMEWEEKRGDGGRVSDRLLDFYTDPGIFANQPPKPGQEVAIIVRPWTTPNDAQVHFEFLGLPENSGKR